MRLFYSQLQRLNLIGAGLANNHISQDTIKCVFGVSQESKAVPLAQSHRNVISFCSHWKVAKVSQFSMKADTVIKSKVSTCTHSAIQYVHVLNLNDVKKDILS